MATVMIEAVGVAYAKARIIDDLSLAIGDGHFFTLLGPSGCGKTTLLRALAGFLPVVAGRILFGDRDVSRMPAHQRDIGMVFQDYALFPDKTVFDNVAYGLRARRVAEAEIRTRVGEHLERVGLSAFPGRRPAELSGGQRQRVALARALVIRPALLLMDEPLSNLDAKLRVQVRETISELQREAGITTVFVTHDQEEALAMSDQIGLMKQGRLEQVGTPADIYRHPQTTYVADFVGGANILPVELGRALAPGMTERVRLGPAFVDAVAPRALPPGKAFLIARPEEIAIEEAQAGPDAAVVASRQYLGDATHYRVALGPGLSALVALHGPAHDRHQVGSKVALVFDPARTLLVRE
jgi:iron(III) transport system ATP-binding protein